MKIRFQEKYFSYRYLEMCNKTTQESVLNRLFAVALKQPVSNLWNSVFMQAVGSTIVAPRFCS